MLKNNLNILEFINNETHITFNCNYDECILYGEKLNNKFININIEKNLKVKMFLFLNNLTNLTINLNFNLLDNSQLFLYCICNNHGILSKNINIQVLHANSSSSITKIFGILKDDSYTNVLLENIIPPLIKNCSIDQNIFFHLNNQVKLAKAIPALNIANNQINSAKHGCIVGDIFSNKLLYIQTKGISINSAKKIILNCYANEILNNFSKNYQEHIKKILKL